MTQPQPIVDETDPGQAFETLATVPGTALVDVRTRAEWTFVGLPDLSGIDAPLVLVEWMRFPMMDRNPGFCDELESQMGGEVPARIFFLCRSGQRSMAAAHAVADHFAARGIPVHCTNVAEGFEGNHGPDGHRGTVAGWKARGLPWRQA